MSTVILLGKVGSILVIVVALVSVAQAVSPPPDGGYPGENTAEGQAALLSLTTGAFNTAVGWYALKSNTDNGFNTAVGAGALLANISAANTALGAGALLSTTTGGNNTANGFLALFSNTIGQSNTATGAGALFANTEGINNTANGFHALFSNTTGFNNTAVGDTALESNIVGSANTASGAAALATNTSGSGNTANGFHALFSNTTGNGNTALGRAAGSNVVTGSNNVYIGDGLVGVAGENNACYIASIFGQTSAKGIPVLINSVNRLGTTTSSKRFKAEIKPMDNASEALYALKPVAFRYKKEIDPAFSRQLGLVAEDVEKVNADLIVRDKEGKPYTVRYDQVNAMLLNEFLKEHRKVEELAKIIAELKSNAAKQGATAARQEKQIQALTVGLEKVSAQIGIYRGGSQMAAHLAHGRVEESR
jgi:hypothetical protein